MKLASLAVILVAVVAFADSKPAAPPAFTLVVPRDTAEGKVKLPCPTGTKQVDGSSAQAAEGFVHCVKWPVAKGTIPIKHGPAVRYDQGAMTEQGAFADHKRTGVWVSWDASGSIRSIITYRDGEYDGRYVTYWANGTPQSEIDWKAGKRHGLVRTWGDDGKPLSIVEYDMDRPVARTDFDADGKPLRRAAK